MIDVLIEGNALSAATARDAILKIAGERAANVNTRLKGIPVEFYPFIAGPKNSLVHQLEEENGVQIRVPPHQAWSSQPPTVPQPGQRPVFVPAPSDNYIQLAGDRAAVQAARAALERRAEELQRQLALQQLEIQRGRHQFIIGDLGIPTDQFFEDTGCAIIFSNDQEDDAVIIVGPPEQVSAGAERAMDLALNMHCSNLDISKYHRQAPGGAAAHARNVTRYLRHRKEIERLEKLYNIHFNTPFSEEGALPWEIFARDGKAAFRAQSEIKQLVESHPPSRIATIHADPFYSNYIRKEIQPKVRQDYRVHLVVPDAPEPNAPILLVYEDATSPESYQVPQAPPQPADVKEMQKWLQDARSFIQNLIARQEDIVSSSIDVPQK